MTAASTGFLAVRQLAGDVTRAIAGVVAEADNLKRLSAQTNLSVEAVDRLSFVASIAESDIQSLARAMDFMARGAVEGKKVFDELGLSTLAFAQADNEGKFLAVAKALRQIEDDGKRAQATFEVFGRTNLEIRGILALTTEEFDRAIEAAKGLGSWNTDTANKIDAAGDSWALFARRVAGVRNELVLLFTEVNSRNWDRIVAIGKFIQGFGQVEWFARAPGVSPMMHIPRGDSSTEPSGAGAVNPWEGIGGNVRASSEFARSARMGFFEAGQLGKPAIELMEAIHKAGPQLEKGVPPVTQMIKTIADSSVQIRDAAMALREHQQRTVKLGQEFGANVVDAAYRAADSWSYFATRAITTGQGVFQSLEIAAKQFFFDILNSLFRKGINEIAGSVISTIIKGGIKFLAHGAPIPGGDLEQPVFGRALAIRFPQVAIANDRGATLNITVNAGFGTRGEGVQAARVIASYLAEAGVL